MNRKNQIISIPVYSHIGIRKALKTIDVVFHDKNKTGIPVQPVARASDSFIKKLDLCLMKETARPIKLDGYLIYPLGATMMIDESGAILISVYSKMEREKS